MVLAGVGEHPRLRSGTVNLRRRLRRLPTDDPAPPPPPLGMSQLQWRMARIALAVVGTIVAWGFASLPAEEQIVGSYVETIRIAPYEELRIRLSIQEEARFTFGWIREHDGKEEDRGEIQGTWQEIEGSVQLTAAWDHGPLGPMHSFRISGDRRVVLVGSGLPPRRQGGTRWTVRHLRRERP